MATTKKEDSGGRLNRHLHIQHYDGEKNGGGSGTGTADGNGIFDAVNTNGEWLADNATIKTSKNVIIENNARFTWKVKDTATGDDNHTIRIGKDLYQSNMKDSTYMNRIESTKNGGINLMVWDDPNTPVKANLQLSKDRVSLGIEKTGGIGDGTEIYMEQQEIDFRFPVDGVLKIDEIPLVENSIILGTGTGTPPKVENLENTLEIIAAKRSFLNDSVATVTGGLSSGQFYFNTTSNTFQILP